MHPLRIGAAFGILSAVIQIAVVQLNHTMFKTNFWVGFIGAFLAPAIILYIAGHWAGRHERIKTGNTVAGPFVSVLHGTSAGLITGLLFVIFVALGNKYLAFLPFQPSNGGAWGVVLGPLGFIGGLVGWFVVGLFLGTVGGIFGDSRAHKELQSPKA